VVAINPGVPTTGGLATSFTATLPEPWVTDESLPIGEPQYYTLFYKIHHPNVEGALGKNNTTIGTIDVENSTVGDFGFYSWPTYNMIVRDGGPAGGAEDTGLPLNGHNGTTYFMPYASATETEADGERMPAAEAYAQPDIWYNVWMVTNMDDLSAEVYFSGGQFGETARLVNIIPNFRNGAAVDHDTILINTSSDGINFPHATFFDDVYATTGKVLTAPAGSGPALPPDWTEISDFEDSTDVDLWTVGPNGENTDPADLPRFILQDDPLASGQGQVVAINPGVPTTGGIATSFTTPLPYPFVTDESLPIGDPQYYTLFYKIHHPNVEGALGKNNTTIGTIDTDNSTIGDFGFYSWPTYNMIVRDGGPAGGAEDTGLPLNSHNGTTYFMPYASATETEADGARMPAAEAYAQPDIWYNVWMVTNMDDLSAEVYFSGGQFGETARLVNIIPNFRNGAALDHDTILINTSSDGINFPHATFFDDVFISPGKQLTVPGGSTQPPAGWALIDNLETQTVGAEPTGDWSVFQEPGNFATTPTTTVVADPFGGNQGNVLAINPGVPSMMNSLNQTIERAIPAELQIVNPITESKPVTLYFRLGRPLVSGSASEADLTWGAVADEARGTEAGLFGYGSYSFVGRIETDGIIDIRDQSATPRYQNLSTVPLETQIWYEIWFVVDHFNNTFSQYVTGGEYTTQTLVYTDAEYQHKTTENLDTLLFITAAGGTSEIKGKDDMYLDDFYIDVGGVNLTSPTAPPVDTTRATGETAGSSTITLASNPPASAVVGYAIFDDGGNEIGVIASISGQVITLEAPLAAALPAGSRLTFVEDNTGGGDPAAGGKLVNISTRGVVGTGDDVLIGGFVVGTDRQQVYISATGPELGNSGVTGFLVDPVLTVTNIATGEETVNDNWEDTQAQLITDLWGGAPPLGAGSLSAALVMTLDTGSYTAKISGAGDTTGIAIIEAFEID
jgi:hypothetical protein